jgi:zinc/manganese transport system substrate-binding protein
MRIILNSKRRAPRRRALRALVVPVAVVAGVALPACSTSAEVTGRVRVVAAENIWGSIARQIAGGDADVVSLISNPATDPHDYEPTAGDARAIATAHLVIVNGIGYDGWAQQLLEVEGESDRVVLNVGDVLALPDDGNPHQWYSRAAVGQVVERVAADLARIDPRHRAGYEARKRALVTQGFASYDALISEIRDEFAGTPIGGTESIVELLAETLGLRSITPSSFVEAVAEGNEPTASDKAIVDAQIGRREIKLLMFNRQNATPDVQRLVEQARRERIPITTVTETLEPEHATFQEWQARQLRAVLTALTEAKRA